MPSQLSNFNSTIVRLKASIFGQKVPKYRHFNSTIVRLKETKDNDYPIRVDYFNSTIVRLKDWFSVPKNN